jgi:hypothetical protein
VLAAVDAGKPREEVAETFSVSEPTIKRWLKRRRESGDVEPRPIPGRPSVKETALQGWLSQQLPANQDLTLQQHREAFEEEHGMGVSRTTISRAMGPVCPVAGPSKKVTASFRARRGGCGACGAGWPRSSMAVGFGVCGREWFSHLHDSPLRPGLRGESGLMGRFQETAAGTRR